MDSTRSPGLGFSRGASRRHEFASWGVAEANFAVTGEDLIALLTLADLPAHLLKLLVSSDHAGPFRALRRVVLGLAARLPLLIGQHRVPRGAGPELCHEHHELAGLSTGGDRGHAIGHGLGRLRDLLGSLSEVLLARLLRHHCSPFGVSVFVSVDPGTAPQPPDESPPAPGPSSSWGSVGTPAPAPLRRGAWSLPRRRPDHDAWSRSGSSPARSPRARSMIDPAGRPVDWCSPTPARWSASQRSGTGH